jgi:hypothetical protein
MNGPPNSNMNVHPNSNMNGPPKGYNSTSDQASYDIVFKDIIVKSENRNPVLYPNPNNYTIRLGDELTKIYKAEIISVNVPAATDVGVNVSSTGNRLYFKYSDGIADNYGYIKIQAGTYYSPVDVGTELQRQVDNVVGSGKVTISYNSNLNRYVFVVSSGDTLVLYPINGSIAGTYIVQDSISETLNLYQTDNLNITKSINIIINNMGILEVVDANESNGWYGNYNGSPVITDSQFQNTIVSNLILTNCNIYLSLGPLNSNTVKFATNDNPLLKSNISSIFCEVPNNTFVSSSSVKTLLNEPSIWSAVNFYNPVLPVVNKLEVAWYNEYNELISNLSNHCFTIRIYYFQKRNATTAFSTSVVNFNSASGTVDSLFALKM